MKTPALIRRIAAASVFVVAVALAWGVAMAGAEAPSTAGPALGTPEQLSAEKTLLALLADPAVKVAQADLRRELQADPAAATPEGQARLGHAVDEWTTSLILREISGDPADPAILWTIDDTPHSWFGYEVPGGAVSGDNPDHIYRGAFIDGAGRYEILGQVDQAHRPAQFSFELTHGQPGHSVLLHQTASHADMGGQIAMRTDQTLDVAPDGSFRITLGGDGDGPNHLALAPGPIGLNVRDVLSDWTQRPNRLVIRRLDAAGASPLTQDELRRRVLADLPDFVRFWAHFKDTWFGGIKPNTIVGPVARDGNWGFLAAARFHLEPGEAAIVRTTRGAARYNGVQVTDPWTVAPDAKLHQTSLNTAQVAADADGGFTYVISPDDPGVANWIDTGGQHDGYVLLRWQGFAPGATADGLLRDFRIVKIADIAAGGLPGVVRATPQDRQAQLALRAVQYAERAAP